MWQTTTHKKQRRITSLTQSHVMTVANERESSLLAPRQLLQLKSATAMAAVVGGLDLILLERALVKHQTSADYIYHFNLLPYGSTFPRYQSSYNLKNTVQPTSRVYDLILWIYSTYLCIHSSSAQRRRQGIRCLQNLHSESRNFLQLKRAKIRGPMNPDFSLFAVRTFPILKLWLRHCFGICISK